jgi:DNA-directed RNA polymerase
MEATIERRTIERFDRKQARVVKAMGHGDTVGAMGIAQRCLQPLTTAIEAEFRKVSKLNRNLKKRDLLRVLGSLPAETLALTALQTTLHEVAMGSCYRDTILALGAAVHAECWAAGLSRHDEKGAARVLGKAQRSQSTLTGRRQAARSHAKRMGYQMARWSRENLAYAGNWLLCGVLASCPEVFTTDEHNNVGITEGGLDMALAAVDYAIDNSPLFLPMTTPPEPWTDYHKGGYPDLRRGTRCVLVRTRLKETIGAVRGAIRNGTMQPVLDAVNNTQSVAWRINEPVLAVLKECIARGINVKGLPPAQDLPKPERPDTWESMSADEQRQWKSRAVSVRTRNRGLVGERILLAEDTNTAALLVGRPFWTPCNLDWRGRVYPLPHFNFQRDDRVRGLFLFDEGAAIVAEGLEALKVQVANCGDFDKISKRPIKERVQWVNDRPNILRRIAERPMDKESRDWWLKADKPFLFLAACMELRQALEQGSTFITRLPISFDGSCSGLQHLCAMTRADEGSLVNLTSSPLPQDVYETVAQQVRSRIGSEDNAFSRMCMSYGIDRKLVKRNVMTYSYSSKKFGMSQQHLEDLMRPLSFQVLDGTLPVHPFASDEDVKTLKDGTVVKTADGAAASKYIAAHVYDAIEQTVTKPALAMGFLQKCARALAHEGKPLEWTTPTGLPWSNRYHVPQIKKVTLYLHDVSVQVNLAVGDEKQIDKDKSANSVAPNFVHALDAAHLALTVNASFSENITQVATVHDSFGCLAPHAARFNEIIREQFVAMYEENDVLAQVLDSASAALTVHNRERLPEAVEYGSLNLKGVLNAQYAFA